MKTLKYKSRAPNPWQQLHGKTGESGARAPISESRLCCQYLTWNHIHTCLRVDSEGEQDKCSPIQKTTHQLLLSARTNMGNMDLTTGLEICCREMPMMFVRRNEAHIVSVEALPPPCQSNLALVISSQQLSQYPMKDQQQYSSTRTSPTRIITWPQIGQAVFQSKQNQESQHVQVQEVLSRRLPVYLYTCPTDLT